jgi:signal transduction histidine kinase
MPRRRLGSDVFKVPPFEEDDAQRTSATLQAVLVVHVVAVVAYGLVAWRFHGVTAAEVGLVAGYCAAQLACMTVVRTGRVKLGGGLAVVLQLVSAALGTLANTSSSGPPGLFIAVLLAGLVFGLRGTLIVGGIASAVVAAIALTGIQLVSIPFGTERMAAGLLAHLATLVVFVTISGRSSLAMLQRLRSEQEQQRLLNKALAQRVRDEETLAALGRLLVESDDDANDFTPAIKRLASTWGHPVALFVRGDKRPEAVAVEGMRTAILVGGDDEAARVVGEDGVCSVTVVDGARTLSARAAAIRTGTVPHGVLVAIVDDARPPTDSDVPIPHNTVDALLLGAAALFAAAFEWRDAAGRLRAAERRRAALVRTSPDGMLIVDEVGTIIDANPAAARLLGKLDEQDDGAALIGRGLSALEPLGADGFKRISKALVESKLGRGPELIPLVLGYADQRPAAHVELRIAWATEDGRGRFDIALRDVTARVEADGQRERLEGQLYAARRLEALGQLAGGVAHDFNNLLSVILTNARLLADKSSFDEVAKEDLAEIVDCGRRAADLTGQLLTFARQQRREPKVLEINTAIRGVEKLLRRLMPTDITLTLELADEPWPVVVDPAQLEQVLVNLVANARDAMEGGGQCLVMTRNHFAISGGDGPPEPGRYVELVVHDTGTGMDDETRAHVFEPFFTTKPLGRGSGLGLATVYGIVKQSGGHISVDSAPGQGTTFRVFLPYAMVADHDEHTPVSGDALSLGKERVLVVDDDDAVRRATERALVSRGFSVLVARSADEALTFQDEAYDAVIADLVMPGLGGDALVERLRQQRRDLPAVLLTGYGRRSVELARPFRLLRKPASPEELARSLRAVIDEASVGHRTR